MGASGVAAAQAPATQAPLEKAVKANFLFKFAPFVEWPPGAAPEPGKAFTICVIGEDPFGPLLDDVVRGQKLSGHSVTVRRIGSKGGSAGCHMLFAGRSGDADYTPFAEIGTQPILTVSDRSSNISGAMIKFVMQAGRVRFQIDDRTARASGLVISSKLLGLAVSVDR
jgi:hypothetical protein